MRMTDRLYLACGMVLKQDNAFQVLQAIVACSHRARINDMLPHTGTTAAWCRYTWDSYEHICYHTVAFLQSGMITHRTDMTLPATPKYPECTRWMDGRKEWRHLCLCC